VAGAGGGAFPVDVAGGAPCERARESERKDAPYVTATPATAPAAGAAGAAGTADCWWHRPFRIFQTNIREVDSGMDVDAVVDDIVGFGADVWLLNAGGSSPTTRPGCPTSTLRPGSRTGPAAT